MKETLIEFQKFQKSFGSQVVHKDISFHLFRGEILGLLGGSGIGKSLILRAIIGLEKPSSGEIFLFGQNTRSWGESDWIRLRKKISYAFQNGALFDSLTVYENLAFPLREHTTESEEMIQKKIFETLEEFQLLESPHKYPAQLSGGMQKRLGLARAIMLRPEVVLFDEPTAGLDPYNTRKIEQMILKLKSQEISGILVTHDIPVAYAICDRIGLIAQGTILSLSTPAEIQANPNHPIQLFAQGLSYQKILEAHNASSQSL